VLVVSYQTGVNSTIHG